MNAHDEPRELRPSDIRYKSGGAIEEILNSLTHAIGTGLAIAALIALLILAGENPDPWKYAAYTIYGVTQIILYLSSALLHGFAPYPRIRRRLNRLDHASIYLLIAGTYTPLTLTALRGPWGWSLFGVIWGLALIGIVMKTWVLKPPHLAADLLYLPMGWLIIVAIKPLLAAVPLEFLVWAVIGGVSYSVGVAFYAWHKLPFGHVIWHFFVLAGSASFFVAYSVYLL